MGHSCTLAQIWCSCTDGNHQGRTRNTTDIYPLSYKDGSGQALRCLMVMTPPDMLICSQLTWTKTSTHGWRIRPRERTDSRERMTTTKTTNSLGTAEQTDFDGCSIRENKPKTKLISLGTVEQTNLHLFGGGPNVHVGLCATRRAHAMIQH